MGAADPLLDRSAWDRLAARGGPLQRLDPRAKLLATCAFLVAVASFDRYAVGRLLPFFAYPLFLALAARVDPGALLRRVALVLPFALLVGLPNPLLDPAPRAAVAGLPVAGGWLSCASIVLRASLCASAALLLLATTGMDPLCAALCRLGVPRPLVAQLLFLHRYAFLLGEQVGRLARARAQRDPRPRPDLATFAAMIGQLLLRTLERAERIHRAMLARGFTGALPQVAATPPRFADAAFLFGWCAFFAIFRSHGSIAALLGGST
jgi:cobalt/nickel transport system permease protein